MFINKKIQLIIVFGIANFLFSCGDLFAIRKQIYGNYYLVEGDTRSDVSLAYKNTTDYEGRVGSQIVEYVVSVEDGLLIVKRKMDKQLFYYVLNIKMDSPYAKESSYLVGTFSEEAFYHWWNPARTDLHFIRVDF